MDNDDGGGDAMHYYGTTYCWINNTQRVRGATAATAATTASWEIFPTHLRMYYYLKVLGHVSQQEKCVILIFGEK